MTDETASIVCEVKFKGFSSANSGKIQLSKVNLPSNMKLYSQHVSTSHLYLKLNKANIQSHLHLLGIPSKKPTAAPTEAPFSITTYSCRSGYSYRGACRREGVYGRIFRQSFIGIHWLKNAPVNEELPVTKKITVLLMGLLVCGRLLMASQLDVIRRVVAGSHLSCWRLAPGHQDVKEVIDNGSLEIKDSTDHDESIDDNWSVEANNASTA